MSRTCLRCKWHHLPHVLLIMTTQHLVITVKAAFLVWLPYILALYMLRASRSYEKALIPAQLTTSPQRRKLPMIWQSKAQLRGESMGLQLFALTVQSAALNRHTLRSTHTHTIAAVRARMCETSKSAEILSQADGAAKAARMTTKQWMRMLPVSTLRRRRSQLHSL